MRKSRILTDFQTDTIFIEDNKISINPQVFYCNLS